MKTKKLAIEESRTNSYFLCKCEFCGEEIIVEKQDFDKNNVPIENKTGWKCCNCGHVNYEKKSYLQNMRCDERGNII